MNYSISVSLNAAILDVEVGSKDAVARFCFYVYVNEKRVFDSGYIKKNYASFDLSGYSGLVRVKAFVKARSEIVSSLSKPVFLSSGRYTLDSEDEIKGGSTYIAEGLEYPVVYFPGEEKILFVMLTAAVNRSLHDIPAFNRWTWAGKNVFPGHVICISDPTIAAKEGFGLGWYFGNVEKNATEGLSRLVKRFAEKLEIPFDKIIVWGSSGGGFASLALVEKIEGATAVVINPQTKILSYEPVRFVDAFFDNCIGLRSVERSGLDVNLMKRLDMGFAWKSVRKSRVLYMQNIQDTHHYEKHFKPFCKDVGYELLDGWSPCGRFFFLLYSDARGHASESLDMAKSAIQVVLQ